MTSVTAESPPQTTDIAALRQDLARAVARVCPGWLAADRDDLVQAALMRVLRKLDGGSGTAQGEGTAQVASSYLHKVAYSVLIDEIRRVRRRRETSLEGEEAEPPRAQPADPERTAASAEIGRGIQSCLHNLARDRRLAVTLHLQGHTVVEAARILAWPEKRTENLVYRGLADLRACLAAKGLRP
jgi:RNA polymerase sigma-70 factor, ECF subfamily